MVVRLISQSPNVTNNRKQTHDQKNNLHRSEVRKTNWQIMNSESLLQNGVEAHLFQVIKLANQHQS